MVEPVYIYRAALVRVVDGDTYWLCVQLGFMASVTVPVRLLHIDVYEHDTPLGQQATKFVTDLLTGAPLLVQTHKDEQTFARYLADIWLPTGDLLSDVLKQKGYAKPDSPWNK
jgi:micrococcal nuclease